MTEIDYTGLAKRIMRAAGVNEAAIKILSGQWTPVAREAVAALHEQGLVVVSREDLDAYLNGSPKVRLEHAFDNLLAALAAPSHFVPAPSRIPDQHPKD